MTHLTGNNMVMIRHTSINNVKAYMAKINQRWTPNHTYVGWHICRRTVRARGRSPKITPLFWVGGKIFMLLGRSFQTNNSSRSSRRRLLCVQPWIIAVGTCTLENERLCTIVADIGGFVCPPWAPDDRPTIGGVTREASRVDSWSRTARVLCQHLYVSHRSIPTIHNILADPIHSASLGNFGRGHWEARWWNPLFVPACHRCSLRWMSPSYYIVRTRRTRWCPKKATGTISSYRQWFHSRWHACGSRRTMCYGLWYRGIRGYLGRL